ncbi:hypothetical protein [Candidatus Nitrotoga sp. 1052]|nr:hypothetical protein [Candidatus Nitrotoga sp. 1052]
MSTFSKIANSINDDLIARASM